MKRSNRITDVSNMRFGKLLVIERDGIDSRNEAVWICRCDCGSITRATTYSLTSGSKKSCGCSRTKPSEYYVGRRYGKLVVKQEVDRRVNESGKSERIFLCHCDCGNDTTSRLYSLTHGKKQSCGCLFIERVKQSNTTHGMSFSRLERVHQSMKQRCENPMNTCYKNYGGRGITVCDNWNDFNSFYNDIKDDYIDGMTIERIDVNGNYCKENIKWIPMSEQQFNKTTNIRISFNGEDTCLSQFCIKIGVPYHMVWKNFFRGLLHNNKSDLYLRFVDLAWFKCVESKYTKPDGGTFINVKTVVYQKGIDGILKLLKEKYGLVPKIVA